MDGYIFPLDLHIFILKCINFIEILQENSRLSTRETFAQTIKFETETVLWNCVFGCVHIYIYTIWIYVCET